MKKRISLIVFVLIMAVSVVRPQIPDNAPWTLYTVKGERFSIALPVLPVFQTSKETRMRPQKDRQRREQITGTIVLKCVFAANGTITNIRVVQGLPYGLTEKAVEAARKIKFVPATKDGKNVSMWMQLEYNFNLY
jgi:TonB family protein